MREMMQDLNRMLREKAEGERAGLRRVQGEVGRPLPGCREPRSAHRADGPADGGHAVAHAEPLARAAQAARRHDALAHAPGRAAGGADAPARHEPERAPAHWTRWPSATRSRATRRSRCQEAMRLMDELQQLDELEREIRGRPRPGRSRAASIPRASSSCWGRRRPRISQRLQELTKRLEEAGYLQREGDELSLTARAIRKIADQALRDIFARAQARSLRWPRHPASRRRRRPDRRDQGLRVRRSVPARPEGDGDERAWSARARARRSASPRTTSRSTAPSSARRRPPSSCST